jgi:hypothetical protein
MPNETKGIGKEISFQEADVIVCVLLILTLFSREDISSLVLVSMFMNYYRTLEFTRRLIYLSFLYNFIYSTNRFK